MNDSMADAVVLPSRPSQPTFADRLRPRKSHVAIGLGLGLAAELFLDGTQTGLGHALFALMLGGAIAFHAGKEAWSRAGAHRWVLGAAVLLFASTMLHQSTWLAAMSITSAIVLFGLAIQGWTGERKLGALRTGQLLGAPWVTFGQSIYAGGVVTSRGLDDAKISTTIARFGPSALRLMVIIVPPALILLLLLSSGDVVFRAKLESIERAIFGVPLEGFIRGAFVTVISSVLIGGALAVASRRVDGTNSTEPRRVLRSFESLALLGTLTSLLFFFGVSSTPCALAPASCELPAGVTYADAAHEGFFQLLAAAIGILMLLMALPARTQLETKKTELAFTSLSTLLVLATMPMVISGVTRLWRYETTYGLTVLRLLAYAGLFLVSAVLAWRAVTLWAVRNWFVGGAMAMFTTTMLALAVITPDAFIAKRNLEMKSPDYAYLMELSDDAMVPLVDRLAEVPDELAPVIEGHLKSRWLSLPSSSILQWNPARSRVERALADR